MNINFVESKMKFNRILLTEKILGFVEEHLSKKLREYRSNISEIKVSLEDINGPYEAGKDKACEIEVYVPFLEKKIKANHVDLSVQRSIEKASEKLAKKIQSKIESWEMKIARKYSNYYWSSIQSLRF